MGFTTISQKPKAYTRVHAVRFAITNTPTARNGRLTIPAATLDELGWKSGRCLEVLAGEGDDRGWFMLKPVDESVKQRAHLKVRSNGVGQFNSQALVPKEITGTMHTYEPETKIDGATLLVRIF